ncbi:MAG: polysaccharide deacetylase family protein [Candidatus Gottesmanbacteria bacterium]|nr:polysaccharide deacetylase family protein [Candidatus Gottesmanbacteria bacterium]
MARKKRNSLYISWKPAALAGVAMVLLGFVWIGAGRQRDAAYRKLLGDERIEVQQNTVPPDVRQWVSEGGVLGANSIDTFTLRMFPIMIRVPILMYHYVEYVKDKGDTIRKSLSLAPYTFEEEVKTLIGAGYTFMTNAELADALSGKITLPDKPIVLTFDDGYRDFYTDVYPILKKYHVKASAYIISGFLGYPNNMDASQVRQIADDGLVEIGAHTVNHAWLKGMNEKELVYEVDQCKKTLERLTGKPVVSFAYPYGVFDVPAIQALAEAGFTSAVSTIPGVDQYQTHRFFLYRLRPGGRTGESLLSWLEGIKNEQISYLKTGVKE